MNLEQLREEILSGKAKYQEPAQLCSLWLAQRPTEAAQTVFSLLQRRPREYVVRTLIPLLAELVDRDETWRTIVGRSLKKKGRCPRELVPVLRKAITLKRGESSTFDADLATEPLFATSTETRGRKPRGAPLPELQTLTLDKEISSITGVVTRLLPQLARPDSIGKRGRVKVDFANSEHFYIFGLVTLAVWLRKNQVRFIQPLNLPDHGKEYLQQIAFFDFIDDGARSILSQVGDSIKIRGIDEHQTEVVASDLVTICDEHSWLSQEDRPALLTLFAEIIENVHRHAGEDSTTVVGAQFYPQRKKLSVIVGDTGMGVLSSFQSGRDSLHQTLFSNDEAIRTAMRPLTTSKPVTSPTEPGHAGYGLFVASELAIRNGGTIAVTSGSSTICRYKKGWSRKEDAYEHPPWKGTLVQVILDLNNLLDIAEVYRALPAARGYEKEDFFE